METDDIALLRAWKAGDVRSGERLFDCYFEPLYGFFRSKVAAGDVEDLVQQVLLATVEAADRFRGESSLRSFIFGIARNVLFQYYRTRTRAPKLDFSVSSLLDLTPSAASLIAKAQDDALLSEAVMRIPLELQVVLELHFKTGLSGPELAVALDIPEGTVRSRLRRALEATRTVIEQSTHGEQRSAGLSSLRDWQESAP